MKRHARVQVLGHSTHGEFASLSAVADGPVLRGSPGFGPLRCRSQARSTRSLDPYQAG